MIVSVIGIVAFTGCSNLDETAERQPLTKNRVAVYSEWRQEQPERAEPNPDAGYEWFY